MSSLVSLPSFPSLLSLLRWEFILQRRYYFWLTALVVSLVWLAILAALSDAVKATWIPVIIFGDIANIGMLFIAGILYLERRQGTLYVTAIMPQPDYLWFSLKLISLTVLCTVCGLLIVSVNSADVNWLRLLPATALTSAVFIEAGLLLALLFDRILNYFLGMALALILLNLPILHHLDLLPSALMWLLPTQPAMVMLADSFGQAPTLRYLASLLLLLMWIGLLYRLCLRGYRRFIALRPQA